jgi:hypothetical protein
MRIRVKHLKLKTKLKVHLKDFPDFNYELVSDPQMAVARGLYIAGTKHFN